MKNSESIKLLMLLFGYVKMGSFRYLIGLLGVSTQMLMFNYAFAIALRGLMDAAISRDLILLNNTLIVLGLSLVILTCIMPVFTYWFDSTIRKMTGKIRSDLFYAIQRLPMQTFEKHHSADLLSRINIDVQTAENAYGWQLALLLMSAIAGIGSGVIIFTIDIRIAIAAIVIGLGNLIVNSLFAKPISRLSEAAQEKLSEASQRLSDILAGFQISKVYGLNDILFKKYMTASMGLLSVSMKRALWQSTLNSVNWFLVMMNFIGMITFGGILVVIGELEFSSLIMATQMMNGVVFMFSAIGGFYAQVQRSLAGAARVFEIYNLPSESMGRTPIKEDSIFDESQFDESQFSPVLNFKDVSFAYNGDSPVIRGLNLNIFKNEKVALVGLSGSGKSTVLKMILGFYDACEGEIALYGKSLKEYSKYDLRGLIAYVPQESYLFDGTLKENISYGNTGASNDEIIAAAKAAFAHDFIMALPKAYDTEVGERGSRLSGGERQRIAIARALLKDAPILLLDEATASLDSESESQVQAALEVLMKGRTCIIIAHRLSTIQNADRILAMSKGNV